jgi:ATPase subunit of ABC transporter with duplicated ATPase domains
VITLREQAKISPDMASRYSAMQTRYDKFLAAGPPPEQVVDQKVVMRLKGGRTGVRALTCQGLELTGLMLPFDLEVFYGERLAVLGSNGSGKSHFLRLLAGQPVAHTGSWRLGARVEPGWFAQSHEQPDLDGRTLVEVLHRGDDRRRGLDRAAAIGALRRYELHGQADQTFDSLSGGQRPGCRCCCSSCPAARCCCSTSPPTTSTSTAPRRSRRGCGPSTARSSR